MTRMDLLNINDETVYNSLIIEFFDSIDIYIIITKEDEYFDAYINDSWASASFKTRQEATNEAIEMANSFYNQSCSQAE